VSAITSIVMSFGVTPTSLACNGALAQSIAAVVAVVAATVVSLPTAVVVSLPPAAVVAVAPAVVAEAAVAGGALELSLLRLQAAAVVASSSAATSADDRDRLPSLMRSPFDAEALPLELRSWRADYTVILRGSHRDP
jgi:hypothetical protein